MSSSPMRGSNSSLESLNDTWASTLANPYVEETCSREESPIYIDQPSNEMLARSGIKVRDFAYESKLPPVPQVRQFPLYADGSRSLKRKRDHYEENNFSSAEVVDTSTLASTDIVAKRPGSLNKPKPLQRTDTEPVLQNISHRPSLQQSRPVHLAELNQLVSSSLSVHELDSTTLPFTDRGVNKRPPNTLGISKETEPWIDTPLVTPNGSLQWREGSPSVVSLHSVPRSTSSSRSQPLGLVSQGVASNISSGIHPSGVQVAQQQGLVVFHSIPCSLPHIEIDPQATTQSPNRMPVDRPPTPPHIISSETVSRYHLRPRRQSLVPANGVAQTHHRSCTSRSSNGDNDNRKSRQATGRRFSLQEQPLRRSTRHRNASSKHSTNCSRKQR